MNETCQILISELTFERLRRSPYGPFLEHSEPFPSGQVALTIDETTWKRLKSLAPDWDQAILKLLNEE